MARVTFNSVFDKTPAGQLTPRQRMRVGGVTLGPGVLFTRGVSFGGIDFSQYEGRDLEVFTDGDVIVITGIY